MEKVKTEKRLLNIAALARLYFKEKGKTYGNSQKDRDAADKYLRLLAKKGKIDTVLLDRAKELYIEIIKKEMDNLFSTPNTEGDDNKEV